MSKIAPPDRRSTGFQTHLERRFTPGRFGGSAIRQVWKPGLLRPACEGRDLANAAPSRTFPGPAQRAVLPPLNSQDHGLIHIVAELGWPTAYPKPGSRVTTTLYA